MAEDFKKYIHKLPLSHQKDIKKLAKSLIAEEMTLQDLRKATEYSQKQLARTLHVNKEDN